MIRKAAKYCAGRFSITVQPAMITGMVMNAVSRISGSEMPSTPERSRRVQRRNPGQLLDELQLGGAGVEAALQRHADSERQRATPASATQRAGDDARSPSASIDDAADDGQPDQDRQQTDACM